MPVIGNVVAIYRYPVKSMAGERADAADIGWHGVEGDRRLALRRTNDRSGFPWLTASKLPEMLTFQPVRRDVAAPALPTHITTPEGVELPIFGDELAAEIERRHRSPVQMAHLRSGIFDEGLVSVIASATVDEIARLAGVAADARRFRPNIVIGLLQPGTFQEDGWVGGRLQFGADRSGPEIAVTLRDERCVMVNFDPDSGQSNPEVLKSIVRANGNFAGVYATVTRVGRVAVGQAVVWDPQ